MSDTTTGGDATNKTLAESKAEGLAALQASMGAETGEQDDEPEADTGDVGADGGGDADEAGLADAEAGDAEGEGGAEEVDFNEIATDILRDTTGPQPGKSGGWEDDLKTKLVAAGLTEKAAHVMAHQGGRESAEKVLEGLVNQVSSEGAHSGAGVEAARKPGALLSEDLLDQLDGQAKQELGETFAKVQESARQEVVALREEMTFLRERAIKNESGDLAKRLVATRKELAGAYPELQSPDQWGRLTPLIKAAVASGLAEDGAEGMRLAAVKLFGVRAAAVSGSDNPDAGSTLKGRNGAAGGRAVTPESAKKRIAQMVFSGASTADIERASKQYKKQLT